MRALVGKWLPIAVALTAGLLVLGGAAFVALGRRFRSRDTIKGK